MPNWLEELFFPAKPNANTGIVVTLNVALDPQLFSEAIRRVVCETETLRLRFRMERTDIRQEVLDLPGYEIEQFDFSAEPDGTAAARQWIEEQFRVPLDWNAFPLFQFFLIKVRPDRYLWVQKFNHLLIDATGRLLLVRRAAEIYNAIRAGIAPISSDGLSIGEVVEADQNYRRSTRYQVDQEYWKGRFSTLPEVLLQGDRRDTERARSGRSKRIRHIISKCEFDRLEAIAKSLGSTAPRIFLVFAYVAFSRLYRINDFVLGFALHGRITPKSKQTIGLFTQNLPLRICLDSQCTLAEAVKQVDLDISKDRQHAQFPPVELGAMLELTRQGRPLYDILVNYIPPSDPPAFQDVVAEISNLSHGFFLPWTITISREMGQLGAERTVDFDFDPGLIGEDEAHRVAKCLQLLLISGAANVNQPISELSLIEDEERNRLISELNRTFISIPANTTLVSLCADQALRTPSATAVLSGDRRIDFASLHARAEILALQLVSMGIGPDEIVGVALPRNIDLVVAVLAIHKAGGAYLPLDPSYPDERLLYILKDSGASIVIADAAIAVALPKMSARLVLLDRINWDAHPTTTEFPLVEAHHLAYVIYTSGSTGLPKGVCVEHRNVVNLILCMRSTIDAVDLSGILFVTSLNFDISVYELFVPLIFGGRMIMVENIIDLANAPAREEIRLINTGPALLDALLTVGTLPRNIRTVNLAGEPLSRDLADRIFAAAPGVRLINLYGPTETTVYSTQSRVDAADRRAPAIGRPIWNTQAFVLDSSRNLLPGGATGELYIGGAGVSRGYLHQPGLTQERFSRNPFGGGYLYRTGDLARWRADGELEYLGRQDNQIKVNGQRVELGEIERRLETLPTIASAIAVARPDKIGTSAIHAYVIPKENGIKLDSSDILEKLGRTLPRHMLPASVTQLTKFPLTPNGKLDRQALPVSKKASVRKLFRAPSNDTENLIAGIWKEVLQLDRVSVDDDFYDLGGTSLQSLMISHRIATVAGVDLSLAAMMQAFTIAGQALACTSVKSVTSDKLVPFRRTGSKQPIFMLHDGWGGLAYARELERHLKSDRPIIGVPPPHLDGTAKLSYTIESIAADYIVEIRKQQAQGPYFLVGYSFGGCVAYEIAQQLVRAENHVSFLGMIDASFPKSFASAKIDKLVAEYSRPNVASLSSFVRKGSAYLTNVMLGAAQQLPNYIRAELGWPIPHPARLSFYGHIYPRAARRYKAQPYPGHVIVFSASNSLEVHYARWQTLALGGVTMREIRADHFEIASPSYSQRLAEGFDSLIEAVL